MDDEAESPSYARAVEISRNLLAGIYVTGVADAAGYVNTTVAGWWHGDPIQKDAVVLDADDQVIVVKVHGAFLTYPPLPPRERSGADHRPRSW